jgi:DNA helicase-2/ATP-dependent DNA helicase PcrA
MPGEVPEVEYPEVGHLLAGLTPAQRAAVTSDAAPLCVLASAGAGKTRVLTRRIAYRVHTGTAELKHTLAVTFTRKAAGELQDRLRQLGLRQHVSAGTFHALASAQLHRWWADRGQQPPALLDRKARLLAPLVSSRPQLGGVPVVDLAGHIEWAQARLIPPAQFEAAARAAGRALPVPAGAIGSLYARYQDEKVRRGLVDFDDLLARCADAMESDPAFAAVQRWRWRHLFVDEFQDLNPLQHRLLTAWVGPSTDLCVVGDPHQAVYGWNGADPGLLAQVPARWPSTEVLYLDDNHRCTPQIVAAAAAVLGADGTRLRSAADDGPPAEVRAYPTDTAEAHGIAAGLRAASEQGRRWASLAVLTRTNAQLITIQEALTAARVPFWSPAQSALLQDPLVIGMLDEVRRSPRAPMQAVLADLAERAGEFQAGNGAQSGDEGQSLLSVLTELAGLFRRQVPDGIAAHWLAWLPSALSDDPRGPWPSDAVTLCSFHRAKGLEWDEVWVAGLERGLVPIGRATSAAAEAEERRLLYVALTRASATLHCSWARQRTFGTGSAPREASPWLELIRAASGDTRPGDEEAPPPANWRRRLHAQREQLGDRGASYPAGLRLPAGWPDPDPEVVGALQAWRASAARAAGIPAYVVLHDATLAALASRRPRTTEELLAVPGLGPVKAGRYGPTLLSLLSDRVAAG